MLKSGFFGGLKVPAKTAVTPVSENTTRNPWVDILRVVVTVIMSLGMIMNYLKVKIAVAFYPLMKRQQPRNVWKFKYFFAQ